MCKEFVSKSETTTRTWNEWKDKEGRLHRRIVTQPVVIINETIIDQSENANIPRRISPINPNIFGVPNFSIPNIPNQNQFFGSGEFQGKPLIDLKAFIETGKRLLKESGIKLEEMFKTDEDKEKDKSAQEIVDEIKSEEPKVKEEVKPEIKQEITSLKKEKEEKCQKKMKNTNVKMIPTLRKVQKKQKK